MSDTSQGPGWWLASDGKWYPPESHPAPPQPPPSQGYGAQPVAGRQKSKARRVWSVVGIAVLVVLALVIAGVVKNAIVGQTLPMSVNSSSQGGIVLGSCKVSGTQVTASGSFNSPLQTPMNIENQPLPGGEYEMDLTVSDSTGSAIATGSQVLASGSSDWSVTASNQQPGVAPAGCVVNLRVVANFG